MKNQNTENLISRPPVVVIMGHIDHGKSTLLDYIRKTNIVAKELGGITQHLGAYEVIRTDQNNKKQKITFLDTPGHEAFGSVRTRGSQVADIAILIISAEDSIKPQTLEALDCIRKNNIQHIIAINKIDSPQSNVEVVKNNLIENGIYIEGYGGNIPCLEISAKTGQNIPELLDMIILMAEISELKANSNVLAEGFIIETKKEKDCGISATILIKNGTLKKEQYIACQRAFSPVRNIIDQTNLNLNSASFSMPVTICGWNKNPRVGAEFKTFENKNDAMNYCQNCAEETSKNKTDEENENKKAIPVIIKADNQGSIDAIKHEIRKIEIEEAFIKIISEGIGNINESDLKSAGGNENVFVIGFGIEIDKSAKIIAEKSNIEIKTNKIIYELIDWLKVAIEKRRPRIRTETIVGEAKILKTFSINKNIQVVGGKIKNGILKVGNKIKIIRREEEIGSGLIKELQQQKIKAREVSIDTECGISLESKIEIVPGDIIQSVEIIEK
jgi:translation initiation factor IF-2